MTLFFVMISCIWQQRHNEIKNKEMGLHQAKTLCTAKEASEKATYGMGKRIPSHISDIGLISKI